MNNTKYDNLLNLNVINKINANSKVLDIGCWKGDLGKYLIDNKNCSVDGIDYHNDVLLRAKNNGYKNTFCINLNCETKNLNDLNLKIYDYIVCADVLEHIVSAESVLKILQKSIDDKTKLIISIPNIAFLKYRILHLLGNFDYTKTGVMDETHVKFYTKKSISKLLKDCGFKIEYFNGYTIAGRNFWFVDYLAKIWPSMFGLQFLIVCTKN